MRRLVHRRRLHTDFSWRSDIEALDVALFPVHFKWIVIFSVENSGFVLTFLHRLKQIGFLHQK